MRAILILLVAACFLGLLAGCCGAPASDPFLKVRSPVWLGGDPVLEPIQYGQRVAAPQAVQLVPLTSAPAIQAPAGCP